MFRTVLVPLVIWSTLSLGMIVGASAEDDLRDSWTRGLRNAWPKKTLGGRWFWSDVFHNHGWRIQQHVVTGHCRLLTPDNVRCKAGTREECETTFCTIVDEADRTRHSDRTVIVVHGLGNWSVCMKTHGNHLQELGYTVVPFDYASNFARIENAAADLEKVIASLPPTDRIDFVGHSLGGMIVRSLLGRCDDERFGRAVLLGTPNNGAEMARMLSRSLTFKMTAGPAGQQLADTEFLDDLPAPKIEFACIAGGRGEKGYNPLIKGNDDGLVGVDAVRLDGAKDFAIVRANHHTLLHDEQVVEMTARFLESGSLGE